MHYLETEGHNLSEKSLIKIYEYLILKIYMYFYFYLNDYPIAIGSYY